MKENEIILQAKELASKFVNKVETGRARSRETYADCKALLHNIAVMENNPEKKYITMIAAQSENGVIGLNNKMLWHIPADLKRFKRLTLNHTITMGRKTYESLPFKPLKGRTNIVISKSVTELPGCIVVDSIQKAIELMDNDRENFIIGGEEIYKQFMPYANKIYLTTINKEFDGDRFFPDIYDFGPIIWSSIDFELVTDDENNDFTYTFNTYVSVSGRSINTNPSE